MRVRVRYLQKTNRSLITAARDEIIFQRFLEALLKIPKEN